MSTRPGADPARWHGEQKRLNLFGPKCVEVLARFRRIAVEPKRKARVMVIAEQG